MRFSGAGADHRTTPMGMHLKVERLVEAAMDDDGGRSGDLQWQPPQAMKIVACA